MAYIGQDLLSNTLLSSGKDEVEMILCTLGED